MTSFIVFPDIDGDSVFPPEVRQAIADAPELEVKYAPISGSAEYLDQIEVLQLIAPKIDAVEVVALLASKLDAAQKGQASGIAALDSGTKLLESNIPDRLSEASQNATYALKTELPPNTLDGLTDVTAPSPSNGQALIWDSATSLWKNTTLATPSSTLDSLTDVTAPSPSNGQALIWDSATSLWKNTTIPTPVSTLDALTDVTAPSPTNGQALVWDSATSQWKNVTLSSTNLTVIAKTANYTLTTTDEIVTFNGSNLTATIPDPTTCSAKVLRIKNLHATDLTVVSAGASKTIDGAASLLITQYLVLTVVSDGATWHIVAGRDSIPSSTFKPGVVDKTSGTNPAYQVYTNVTSTLPAVQFNAVDSYNRPGLRVAVSTGPNGPAIETGTIIATTFYSKFAVSSDGKISKLNGVDFTMSVSAANPQDQISSGVIGITTDTNPGLTYLKRATGNPWPAWNFQPFGYFGQPQTKTANWTVDFRDTMLIGNGSNITFTLPDPTASGLTAGRKFEFKNIHSTNLTIVSAGSSKTIDGAASAVLTQWEKVTVMTDGAQWLIVSGKRQATVSATAPSSPTNGDIWFDIS